MSLRNCRRTLAAFDVKEGPHYAQDLDHGYVGVAPGNVLIFRPTRGSQGFSLYSSAAKVKQYTGLEAKKVTLRLVEG